MHRKWKMFIKKDGHNIVHKLSLLPKQPHQPNLNVENPHCDKMNGNNNKTQQCMVMGSQGMTETTHQNSQKKMRKPLNLPAWNLNPRQTHHQLIELWHLTHEITQSQYIEDIKRDL